MIKFVDFENGSNRYFKCICCGAVVNSGNLDFWCCSSCESVIYARLSAECLKKYVAQCKKQIEAEKKEKQDN